MCEHREGTDAENVAWSIKTMELLLCTLGFLWLTSTSADRILLQNRHAYRHTQAQTCTHLRFVQIHQHACTFKRVFAMENVGTKLDGINKARGLKDKRDKSVRKKETDDEIKAVANVKSRSDKQGQQHSSVIFIYPFTCACCNNMNTIKHPS